MVVLASISVMGLASLSNETIWLSVSFIFPAICLLIGSIGSKDGYRTIRWRIIDSFVHTLPIVIWIFLMIGVNELSIIINILIILYVEYAFKKLSG